jgi:hypothetical protein
VERFGELSERRRRGYGFRFPRRVVISTVMLTMTSQTGNSSASGPASASLVDSARLATL